MCAPKNSNIEAPVYADDTPRWVLNGTSRWEAPRVAFRLAALLRRWRADILHTHHYDQAVIGWMATRIYPRTRLVIGRHYSDSIYRSTTGMKRKALLAFEQVVEPRGSPDRRSFGIRRRDPDPAPGDRPVQGGQGELRSRPREIPRLQPAEVERRRDELGLRGRLVIGNFSRLHEGKGLSYLVQAMAELRPRLPELLLLIVGEGPERPALEQQIKSLGLGEAVRLLGWRRDAMALMAAVDAVVQPTLEEAFSQVMAEALWMGKPLVITDVGGVADIIRHAHNGLLVPKGDVAALVNAIERLVGDPASRNRLGAAGRALVRDRLDINHVIAKYENVL